jgi:hypothetical protein
MNCKYCGKQHESSAIYCSVICQMEAYALTINPVYWPAPIDSTQAVPTRGCICPPTSEQTCQNVMCPRKGVTITA